MNQRKSKRIRQQLADRWAAARVRLRSGGRWSCVVASLPTAWMAVLFWRQESIDPLTAGNLLLDWFIRVLTLGIIPAIVVLLFAADRAALTAAACLSAICIVISLSVFGTGVLQPPTDWNVVMTAAVGVLGGLWILMRFGRQVVDLGSFGAKASVALVAVAVPLLQFWNSVSFLPSRTEAVLALDVSVEQRAVRDGMVMSELTFTATNSTDARVLVIIGNVAVCAYAAPWPAGPEVGGGSADDGFCLASWAPIGQRMWVPANSEFTSQLAIETPSDMPRLVATARIAYARGDRLRVSSDDPKRYETLGTCSEVLMYRLDEESRLKGVAQTDKFLFYRQSAHDEDRLNFGFTSGPDPKCENSERLADYFGRVETRTVSEQWVTLSEGQVSGGE